MFHTKSPIVLSCNGNKRYRKRKVKPPVFEIQTWTTQTDGQTDEQMNKPTNGYA